MNIKNLSNSLLAGATLGLATALSALSPQMAQAAVSVPGLTQDNPVLPSVSSPPGEFLFPTPTPRRWFDPPLVSRFDYSLGSGQFLSFILPSGFSNTTDLYVGDTLVTGGTNLISDGVKEYSFFTDFGLTDVTAFSLRDISPLVDGADPKAFPTFLDFTSGATSLTMKPVSEGVAVPEPNSLFGLVALGTLGAASTLKRKLNSSKSSDKETTKVG